MPDLLSFQSLQWQLCQLLRHTWQSLHRQIYLIGEEVFKSFVCYFHFSVTNHIVVEFSSS